MTAFDDTTLPSPTPIVGVIGGSGLYSLLERPTTLDVPTPYGPTSSPITVGDLGGVQVAFLARHGSAHTLPPHRVPYRANIWAMASLGVHALVSSSAVGSLSPELPPCTFVIPDQLIDRTWGRDDTFFDGDDVQHLPFSDPYCARLRAIAMDALTDAGEQVRASGTTVVVQGPRFSTRAESRWYRTLGADLVNMTQYPEAALAAELNLGMVNLSYVTDSDAGESEDDAVDPVVVLDRLAEAQLRIRSAIAAITLAIPNDYRARARVADEAVRRVLEAGVAI
ncbi:S-methyl-5'-thioinosine phosphorylase [Humibacter ginsenosidimutans]|uniref:Purine nucleoside phosphorylase n=1 Tax=Humibacter ginsenosidimutans TaxID=2599293 RepID=A0A5B8M6V7_9MICO|nr:S-methyl-5'-thioinosine phosphorylase [Humibacter ginsenosidimutans]QDZ16133.1 S-methyl-5'-thioinosine phosphorylase [Humibacter ginsenosidimutans]